MQLNVKRVFIKMKKTRFLSTIELESNHDIFANSCFDEDFTECRGVIGVLYLRFPFSD
jgi:hypothetical protein